MNKIVATGLIALALTCRAAAQCGEALKTDQEIFGPEKDGQWFGTAVATSGPWLFVSQSSNPDGIQLAGAVNVYKRTAGSWKLRQVLTASDADEGDNFGTDLAVDGILLVVGARDNDDGCGGQGWCDSGSAYVFELGSAGWVEVAKLTASDAGGGHEFGSDVALHQSTIVVGAYRHTTTGAAYVFERQASAWVETAKLLSSDLMQNDYFGKTVAVWGNTVAVGSYLHDLPLNQAGAVYIFTKTSMGWTETQKVQPAVPKLLGRFGTSVSFRGDQMLIGAEGEISANGAAYFFERQGGGWYEKLRVHGTNCQDGRFGREVKLRDGRAIVASECRTYLFELLGPTWEETRRLPAANDTLEAYDLALGSGTIFVSDAYDDTVGFHAGAVWSYRIPTGTSYCTAYPNSTGSAAEIWYLGCPSIGVNTFGLVAAPVPDDVGFFVYGTERAIIPYGGQIVCVGAPLYSLRPVHADGGALSTQVDFLVLLGGGTIFPSTTWYFQACFRDTPAGPGVFNGSNGLEVTFLP